MRSILVAFLLGIVGIAGAQSKPPAAPAAAPADVSVTPAAPPPYKLTELQMARLDAARQKVFRWEDRTQDALNEFSALCTQAQQENHWPPVNCGLNDLSITSVAPPPVAKPAAPAAPPKK
jgi:hypothetical protein